MFSSKTAAITDKVRQFIEKKLMGLQKFSSLGVEQLQVVIDRVKRGGRNSSEAQIEVVAQLKGARYAFKEVGDNLFQVFFRVYRKIEEKLGREKAERKKRK
ncbi:MAG: HPF/RaiA family ribosome-associated protein [Candidatus Pacebacteria bacterium]|nr:HPF/RaiA family ribosome-associated protein [Candidatus Paceibacterota bacterium]